MRILLTGGTGQIGWELRRSLLPLGEVVAPTKDEFDLTDFSVVRRVLEETTPDVVVNAAAYTNVDGAEQVPSAAYALNAEAPGVLAREARRFDTLVVHYSTDYVFDGKSRRPYEPGDETHPLNAYGTSKLIGEEAVRRSGTPYLIFRTSWVYGNRRTNFLNTMCRLMRNREHLSVVDDQVGSPTWCRLVAEATALVLSHGREVASRKRGTYHLTCSGSTSWHGFATTIKRLLAESIDDCEAKESISDIRPVGTEDYPTAAKRPEYSVLSNRKTKARFGIALPRWERALELCMDERRLHSQH